MLNENYKSKQVWLQTPINPALGKQKEKEQKLEIILGYTVNSAHELGGGLKVPTP